MKKTIMAFSLSVALLTPVYVIAQDHDDHHDADHRYYDREHKDYHDWNAREDRAWHMYWEQEHRPYIDWARANEEQREAYWRWRHNHSDAVLHIDIR